MSELRPCPNCEGDGQFLEAVDDGLLHWIVCNTDGCELQGPIKNTFEEAKRAWDALPRWEDMRELEEWVLAAERQGYCAGHRSLACPFCGEDLQEPPPGGNIDHNADCPITRIRARREAAGKEPDDA